MSGRIAGRSRCRKMNLSVSNNTFRAIWGCVWLLFFRTSPRPFHWWRCFLLRLFGAKLGLGVHPYPSARVWAPWNLERGDHSCLSEHVDCYCVDKIRIGAHSTISQYSFLCSASHDYLRHEFPLMSAPIVFGDWAWITADVFIAPGVEIGDGTECPLTGLPGGTGFARWTEAGCAPPCSFRGFT